MKYIVLVLNKYNKRWWREFDKLSEAKQYKKNVRGLYISIEVYKVNKVIN